MLNSYHDCGLGTSRLPRCMKGKRGIRRGSSYSRGGTGRKRLHGKCTECSTVYSNVQQRHANTTTFTVQGASVQVDQLPKISHFEYLIVLGLKKQVITISITYFLRYSFVIA